jgi:hypothetical protein
MMAKGRKAPQPRPYLGRLLAAAEIAASQGRGGLVHVEVRHDTWCNLLNGRGGCNCSPTVHAGPAVQRRYTEGERE